MSIDPATLSTFLDGARIAAPSSCKRGRCNPKDIDPQSLRAFVDDGDIRLAGHPTRDIDLQTLQVFFGASARAAYSPDVVASRPSRSYGRWARPRQWSRARQVYSGLRRVAGSRTQRLDLWDL